MEDLTRPLLDQVGSDKTGLSPRHDDTAQTYDSGHPHPSNNAK